MVTSLPETLAGRYRLEEPIASGGMGSVVRAHDEVLVRTVAVKLLRESLAGDEDAIERFRREARIAASLGHPGIAQVFDFGQERDQPFIVMEFLEGEDLHTLVRRDGPMDPAEAAKVTASVADALQHAHGAGTVHRDVKPGNIFRTSSGTIKLTDFGIARAEAQTTVTTGGAVMGTYHYLSPEQVNGDRASPASDIYALGCVLFELITGRPPFEADNPMAVAMFHVSRVPPDVRELRPEVPPRIAQVITTAMAKNPSDRFDTAGHMAAALREAVGVPAEPAAPVTEPISAEVEETALLTIPPSKGRSHLPLPVMAVVGAALILLILLFALQRQPVDFDLANYTGQQVAEAQREAQAAGLTVVTDSRPSARPEGEVIDQEPAPGTRLRPGGSITLFVSAGGVQVPNLIGKIREAADQTLRDLGLEPSAQGDLDDPDAIVAAQDPLPQTSVATGEVVTFRLEGNGNRGEGGRGNKKGKDED